MELSIQALSKTTKLRDLCLRCQPPTIVLYTQKSTCLAGKLLVSGSFLFSMLDLSIGPRPVWESRELQSSLCGSDPGRPIGLVGCRSVTSRRRHGPDKACQKDACKPGVEDALQELPK
jgi:hypothetical protein